MTDSSHAAPTPADRLYRIVEEGMCTGCGLCESVAGPSKVVVQKVASGYECPVVVGPLDHDTVDRIYAVCPGTRVEGLPVHQRDAATRDDLIWGAWQHMVLGWAADPAVRHQGSTGGVLSALSQYLLESGRVAFIMHVKAGGTSPAFGQPHLSFDGAAVLEGAGSRYGPAAPLRTIEQALSRNEPFAFIGKPCDIAALRNLACLDPRVNEQVRYWLTPVCGGYMPPEGMTHFLESQNIAPDELTHFRYRGFGCPGAHRAELANGEVREVHYLDFWGEDESQWMLPFRCKVCPDGIGESADIAAADTWPGGSPERLASAFDLGTNALVVRSAAGLELVQAAARDGALVLSDEVDPRYMDSVQPLQRRKKLAVRARFDGLAAAGRQVPATARLRLDELALENGDANNRYQAEGTQQRVEVGKATQPRPALAHRGTGE